jgi:hypothetical protein
LYLEWKFFDDMFDLILEMFLSLFVDVCLYINNMFNLMLNVSLLYGSLLTYNYICLCMDDVYLIVNVYSISTIKYFDYVYNF